jgi:hypothetical protein
MCLHIEENSIANITNLYPDKVIRKSMLFLFSAQNFPAQRKTLIKPLINEIIMYKFLKLLQSATTTRGKDHCNYYSLDFK